MKYILLSLMALLNAGAESPIHTGQSPEILRNESVRSEASRLYPCGTKVKCPESAWAKSHTCKATKGPNDPTPYITLKAGNECYAELILRENICKAGKNPSLYNLTCKEGIVIEKNGGFFPCNISTKCAESAWVEKHFCNVKEDPSISTTQALNECNAERILRKELCDRGLNPTDFTWSCVPKNL